MDEPWCYQQRSNTNVYTGDILTDTGSDVRATLLVSLGAAIAGDARHAVLAGALARGLVAGLARGADGVAVAGWNRVNGE